MRRSRTSRLGGWFFLVALGAGGMYAYQLFLGPSGAASPESTLPSISVGLADDKGPSSVEAVSVRARVDGGELLQGRLSADGGADSAGHQQGESEAGETAVAPVSAEEVARPTPSVVVLGVEDRPVAPQPKDVSAKGNPLDGATVEDFQEAYENAKKALAEGNSPRALELYRMIFDAAKDRSSEIDVSVIARKLVEATSDDHEKLGYYKYLAEGDGGVVGHFHAQFAAAKALSKDRSPKNVRPAWRALTKSYLAATTREERFAVLESLRPFLRRHVFSARPSPLLKSYQVERGDYLASVAKAHNTTIDAIKRINHLNNEIIQAGKRLLVLPGPTSVLVKKSEFRLALFVDGNLLLERPIGTGADGSTPEGTFLVSERQKNPIWYRPGEAPILPEDSRNILGSRWLGFRDTSTTEGIGIHGTTDDSSIGKEVSSGCVRLRNADVELVYDFVRHGSEVVIEY